jgi:hypothetical protein
MKAQGLGVTVGEATDTLEEILRARLSSETSYKA